MCLRFLPSLNILLNLAICIIAEFSKKKKATLIEQILILTEYSNILKRKFQKPTWLIG